MGEPYKRPGWKNEKIINKEKIMSKPKGVFWDEIWKKDEQDNVYCDHVTKKCDNIIVNVASDLLAGLMLNEPTFTGGILQHAVGEGFLVWDISLPNPVASQTTLNTELARLAPDSIVYLDGSDNPTATITSKIRIKTTFDFLTPAALNGKFIREQGLFGGDATSTTDSGIMIDAINHVKIFKDATIRIVRFIDLTF